MKKFFKVVLAIIVSVFVLGIIQVAFQFSISDILKDAFGGTELKSVSINVGQEFIIPKFEIVSQDNHHTKNQSYIEAHKFEWWRLNIGDVGILIEYDSYYRLGVRNPDLIPLERIGDIIYVDESAINVELLDVKINNFRHIRTFKDPLVINNNAEEYIFDAINRIEREFEDNIIINNQRMFDSAKLNFMMNYENLCRALGLNVVWR